MNKRNPALDVYIDAMRDVTALKRFRLLQEMKLIDWEMLISKDVRDRLVGQGFVSVKPARVHLTLDGLKMLEYDGL